MSTEPSAFAEAASEQAKESGGDLFRKIPFDSLPFDARGAAKALIKSRGDGQNIDEIQESLGCGRGPAHVIRGIERAAGIDTIPPVGEIVFGLYRTAKGDGGAKNDHAE